MRGTGENGVLGASATPLGALRRRNTERRLNSDGSASTSETILSRESGSDALAASGAEAVLLLHQSSVITAWCATIEAASRLAQSVRGPSGSEMTPSHGR